MKQIILDSEVYKSFDYHPKINSDNIAKSKVFEQKKKKIEKTPSIDIKDIEKNKHKVKNFLKKLVDRLNTRKEKEKEMEKIKEEKIKNELNFYKKMKYKGGNLLQKKNTKKIYYNEDKLDNRNSSNLVESYCNKIIEKNNDEKNDFGEFLENLIVNNVSKNSLEKTKFETENFYETKNIIKNFDDNENELLLDDIKINFIPEIISENELEEEKFVVNLDNSISMNFILN